MRSIRVRYSGLCLMVLMLAACGGDATTSPSKPAVASLAILQPDAIYEGSTVVLQTVARNSVGDEVPAADINWSSANAAIATVSSTGRLSAISAGTVNITATSGEAHATMLVSVLLKATLVIGPNHGAQWPLRAGQTLQLTVMVIDDRGQAVNFPVDKVHWTSDQPIVATIDASGLVTAVSAGQTPMHVSLPGVGVASVSVTVENFSGAASVRLVNAVSGSGTVKFTSNAFDPVSLNFEEMRNLNALAGFVDIELSGAAPAANWGGTISQSFMDVLHNGTHATFVAAGDPLSSLIIPLWDDHAPIAANAALVRVVMSSNYSRTYNANNIYFATPGAKMTQDALVACYFHNPEYIDFVSRAPTPFDIIVADAGSFGAVSNSFEIDIEAIRFSVNPAPGKATTYIIVGDTPNDMHVITLVDQ